MNAARPDLEATPAERALYDERYKTDHLAELALLTEALDFATWASDTDVAACIEALKGEVERLRKLDQEYGRVEAAIIFARSEEHTSELQSLMRISYAVLCLTKKIT